MINVELIKKILDSTWCTLPSEWSWTLRSSSYLKILDLFHPDTYGIHVAYHLLTNEVCYVLIVLPDETDITNDIGIDLDNSGEVSDRFNISVYKEAGYQHLVFYRKELDNVGSKCV